MCWLVGIIACGLFAADAERSTTLRYLRPAQSQFVLEYLFSGSGVEKTSVFSLTRAISGPDDNKGIISRSSTIG
jgi:hypothetical protein